MKRRRIKAVTWIMLTLIVGGFILLPFVALHSQRPLDFFEVAEMLNSRRADLESDDELARRLAFESLLRRNQLDEADAKRLAEFALSGCASSPEEITETFAWLCAKHPHLMEAALVGAIQSKMADSVPVFETYAAVGLGLITARPEYNQAVLFMAYRCEIRVDEMNRVYESRAE